MAIEPAPRRPGSSLVVAALFLTIGLARGVFFIGHGIANRNNGRRIVSVKGLSEREVPASVAVWSVGYEATGNDLDAINQKLAGSTKTVVSFLNEASFEYEVN